MNLCNKSVVMENLDDSHQTWGSISQCYHKSIPCTFSKDNWDTKESTGKSMKHALYVLRRYASRGEKTSNSEKNQAVALAIIELCLSLKTSVSESVSLADSLADSLAGSQSVS